MLPERSNVFDVGVDQKIYAIPGLEVGLDAYYKTATDLLDDGQFGQAYVLTAFNYARGTNEGVEFKANYTNGNLHVYGNLAWARQIATDVVSNQYLFDPAELAYIANNYVYTDHAQFLTASAGASYLWKGTKFSASMIYGSGLRDGFANTGTVPSYTQVNLGRVARFQHRVADQADHAALRHRQPVRHHLPDQGRLRHRRVRAAIRAAPRLLFRHFAEAVSAGRVRDAWHGRAQRAKLQSGRIAPETPVNAPSTSSATSRRS